MEQSLLSWRYDYEPGYCGEIIREDGVSICTFNDEPDRDDQLLMTAAPELLAALQGLLPKTFVGHPTRAEVVAHWERERDLGNGMAPPVLAAFAAVAKATGAA